MRSGAPPPPLRATRLLDQVRERLRYGHYSLSTERSYVYWVRWFVRFHSLRHPRDVGAASQSGSSCLLGRIQHRVFGIACRRG